MNPICPSCKNTSFKLARPLGGIQGARFDMPFVICARCGAVMAVVFSNDPGVASVKAKEAVDDLATQVRALKTKLANLEGYLQALGREQSQSRALVLKLTEQLQPTLDFSE